MCSFVSRENKIYFDKVKVVSFLDTIMTDNKIDLIREKIDNVCAYDFSVEQQNENKNIFEIDPHVFQEELNQIAQSQTVHRAHHYTKVLRKGFERVKTLPFNDINLNRWKEYEHIITDSLWHMTRDNSGKHMADYHGNFIPQIPRQMMYRYTKKNDWVLDGFLGSGTTLIECKRLGRNGIGVELNPDIAKRAKKRIDGESNPYGVNTHVISGDSCTVSKEELFEGKNISSVQHIILHPPYHDIISFSNNEHDLSNAPSIDTFFSSFEKVIRNLTQYLDKGRFVSIVIGDKYEKRLLVPLGFQTVNLMQKLGFPLKAIIVKNMEKNRAKRAQERLWRYRALAGSFYIFKHEYLFVFEKPF